MIIVQLKDGENIERALKKFKRKFERTGITKDLRRRQAFEKPSGTETVRIPSSILTYLEQDGLIFQSRSVHVKAEKAASRKTALTSSPLSHQRQYPSR